MASHLIFAFLDRLIRRMFRYHAISLCNHPKTYIFVPLLMCAIFSTCFLYKYSESCSVSLFSIKDRHIMDERRFILEHSYLNLSTDFDSQNLNAIGIFKIVSPLEESDTLSESSFIELVEELDEKIKQIVIKYVDKEWTYNDLCVKLSGSCYNNRIGAMVQNKDAFLNIAFRIRYPLNNDIVLEPVEFNKNELVEEFEAALLFYPLDNSDIEKKKKIILWKESLSNLISEWISQKGLAIEVVFLEYQIVKIYSNLNSLYIGPFYLFALILMAALYVNESQDLPWWSLLMLLTSQMATITACGICAMCGDTFVTSAISVPLIMLGINHPDALLFLDKWRESDPRSSPRRRVESTLEQMGPAAVVVLLCKAVPFAVGLLAPFPRVVTLCLYFGMSIIVTFFFQMTFLPATFVLFVQTPLSPIRRRGRACEAA